MAVVTLYFGTDPNVSERTTIKVSTEDYKSLLPRGNEDDHLVIDLDTGLSVVVRWISCGLPRCRCALERVL